MAIIFAATEPGHLNVADGNIESFSPYDPLRCRAGVRGYWGNAGGRNDQFYSSPIVIPTATATWQNIYVCAHFVTSSSATTNPPQIFVGIGSPTEVGAGFFVSGSNIFTAIQNVVPVAVSSISPISAGLHKIVLQIQYQTGSSGYDLNLGLYIDDVPIVPLTGNVPVMPSSFSVAFSAQNTSTPKDTLCVSELIVSTTDPSRMQLWTRVPQAIPLIDSTKWFGGVADINEMQLDNSTYMQCLDTTEPYYAVQMTQPSSLPAQMPIAYVTHITTSRTVVDEVPNGVSFGVVDNGSATMSAAVNNAPDIWGNSYRVLNTVQTGDTNRVVIVRATNAGNNYAPIPYP